MSVNTVSTPKVEAFYWATITFSQTLGTALGDWVADTGGLGYEGGALVFTAGLVAVAALIAGRAFRASPFSGSPLSSPGLSAQPWAISSTSLSATAAWT